MRLELGEGHFDGIEVGAVGRQKEEPCPFCSDGLLGRLAFMRGEVVENDDVSFTQGGGELGFNPGLEDTPVHRLIDHKRSGQSALPQSGDECLSFPMSEWRLGPQPSPLEIATPKPRHLGRRAGLIDKDQPVRVAPHSRLSFCNPLLASSMNVRPTLFGCQQRFFYNDSRCAGTNVTAKPDQYAVLPRPIPKPVLAS